MSGIGTNLGKYLHPARKPSNDDQPGRTLNRATDGDRDASGNIDSKEISRKLSDPDYVKKYGGGKPDEPEPVDNATEEAAEPGVGSKLAGRLRPGMFKAKPKTAQQQSDADKKAESENAQNATRASLIGTRG